MNAITGHPRQAGDGYEVWEEDDRIVNYPLFTGDVEADGSVRFTGGYTIIVFNECFVHEGREYVLGEVWLSEESGGIFRMVRDRLQ